MQSQQSSNSRCLRTFADGRQCRMLRKSGHPALCVFHAREEEQILESEKLAAELSSLSGNLNTGLDINHVLGKVFQALAQRKISAREATAFAYIVQLSLQSMPYVKSDIRWATNDAGAYHRMVRQTVPTIRDLPQRPPASPPSASGVAHPSPEVEAKGGSFHHVEPRASASAPRAAHPSPGFSAPADSKKTGSVESPAQSSTFSQVLSSTQSPAQAFLAARRAASSSTPRASQSQTSAPSGAAPSTTSQPPASAESIPTPPQPQTRPTQSRWDGHVKSPAWSS